MENLDKSWEKLSQSLEAEGHFSRKEILRDLRTESSQPIKTLLKNVRLKMYFSLGFIPLFIIAIFILKPLPVKLFMAAIALAYIIVSYLILQDLQQP
jgi:ABC-type protease/lipase transport system fused ATPase/permease subunit